jgi:hypothetical protein
MSKLLGWRLEMLYKLYSRIGREMFRPKQAANKDRIVAMI